MTPTGSTFIRTMRSLAMCKGDLSHAQIYAGTQPWANKADVLTSIKAAISSMGTDETFIGTPAANDFVALMRPLSVVARLGGIRRAPARTRVISPSSGTVASWTGERGARPLTKMAFSSNVLEPLSVQAMAVAMQELLQSSSPDAEAILTADLTAAAAAAIDTAFIDHTSAGQAGVKPAAISYNTFTLHSQGTSLANIDADMNLLIEALSDYGSNLASASWVLRPRSAIYLAGLRGSGGAPAFPTMTAKGGTLLGLPALVSAASHSDSGSPAEGGGLVLVDGSQVVLLDEGQASFGVTTQASIAMSDVPGSPANLTSLFQAHAVGMRVTRYMNWEAARPNMCVVLDQVNW